MQGIETLWVLSLIGGFLVIVWVFWSRFDEATHTAKLEFFQKYAPRFATREREFRRARYCYVALVAGCYLVLALSPQILAQVLTELRELPRTKSFVDMLIGEEGNPATLTQLTIFPALLAAVLAFGNRLPGFAWVEYRIRSFFHSLGKIPESVQATVRQLKSSAFDHRACCDFSDPARVKELLGITDLSEEAVMTDDVLHTWCTVCCVTERLRAIDSGQLGIRDDFLQRYGNELDEIIEQRDETRRVVSEYADTIGDDVTNVDDRVQAIRSNARHRVRTLRERLFVFIACGFHSSAATDAAVAKILRNFGFGIRLQQDPNRSVVELLGAICCYIVVMSFIAALLADRFHAWAGTDLVHPILAETTLVPTEHGQQLLWTLTSGLFSLTAIVVAFSIRRARLNRHDWFRFGGPVRRRPLLSRYVLTSIIAGLAGFAALFVVCMAMSYFYGPTATLSELARGAVFVACWWAPMALIVAFASLHVADEDFFRRSRRWNVGLAIVWSAVVAVVGFLAAYQLASMMFESAQEAMAGQKSVLETQIMTLNATGDTASVEPVQKVLIPIKSALQQSLPTVEKALFQGALLISFLIFLQTLFVMLVLRAMEHAAQSFGALTGRWLNLSTSEGHEQDILLKKDGGVFAMDNGGGEVRQVGRWIRYPQCHILHWDDPLPLGRNELRDIGLLERIGGCIMYVSLSEGSPGDFVAQGSFTERHRPARQAASVRLSIVGA